MKYRVLRREVWVQVVFVEADNEQEALKLVERGDPECDSGELDFEREMDVAAWTVEEEEGITMLPCDSSMGDLYSDDEEDQYISERTLDMMDKAMDNLAGPIVDADELLNEEEEE